MRGFSLLETLVAIAILIGAVLGPLTLASQSIRSASLARNQITAVNLAEEAMEYIRNRRDSNVFQGLSWTEGFDFCSSPEGCYLDLWQNTILPCGTSCPLLKRDATSGLFNYVSGPQTLFGRKLRVLPAGTDELKVIVEVFWQEKFLNPGIILQESLFRWH